MDIELGEVQAKFAGIIWEKEPILSGELTKICEKELGWKKSTTYTVLKKLCEKGIFQNINGTVTSTISKDAFYFAKSEKFVNENYYTVITLKSKQIDYIEYFLDVVCIVLEKLGDFPSQQDLLNEIQKLVELFRRFSRPPIKTIQGLWAELFVIEHSSNPSYLVKSWHTTTSDIFDFNDGTDKLEVKSTSRINRVHRFSHNQLTPNESSIVVIASLCVQQSGVGKTVLDLMDAIEPNLENAELRFQLADMISKTLGSDFEKACEYYFDYALACDTYQKYNCKDIPYLDYSSIPAEISDIHYDCDLSKVTPLGVPSEIFPNSKLIKSL